MLFRSRQKWTRRSTWNGKPSSESGSSNTGGRYRRNSIRRRRGINGCERISPITGKKGRGFKSGKTLLVARKLASGCKETVIADQHSRAKLRDMEVTLHIPDNIAKRQTTRSRQGGFRALNSSSHSTAVAMALSIRASSSSVTSENISRLFLANLPLFCIISRTSREARLSGMSTISFVSSNARSYF